MTIGLIGKKCGMTSVFDEDGVMTPVTVVNVQPHFVTQVKRIERDGYSAIQVTTGKNKPSRLTKPLAGQFAKAGVEPGLLCREFRCDETTLSGIELGKALTIDWLKEMQFVDVRGITKGKGFAGVVKRHGFRTQDATHGNSLSHRALGATGQCQTPGRVFKGKKMSGRMGGKRRVVLALKVVKVDLEKQFVLIKGAVPGPSSGIVVLTPSVKKKKVSRG